jgi:hypothetical protein
MAAEPSPPKTSETSAEASAPEAPPPQALLPALAAFDRGDFRESRRLLNELLAGSPAPELAAAARALGARMAPDPWAVRVALVALGVLALVIGIYI